MAYFDPHEISTQKKEDSTKDQTPGQILFLDKDPSH